MTGEQRMGREKKRQVQGQRRTDVTGGSRSSFPDAVSGVWFWLSGRNRSTKSKSQSVAYDFKLPTQKPCQEAHSSGWYLSYIGSFSSHILTTGYLLSADFVLIFLPVLPTYQWTSALWNNNKKNWSKYYLIVTWDEYVGENSYLNNMIQNNVKSCD